MRFNARYVALNVLTLAACISGLLRQGYGAEGPGQPVSLKCEYLVNPLGIDVRQPRLSWVLEHSERGQMQTAYQVQVATSPALLEQGKGDLWDSGKVASEDSTQVVYGGKALDSGHAAYWRVRYWDKGGNASPYSAAAMFEMGLLAPGDWKAQWIGGNNLLRKEVAIAGKIARARAYVTALGYYELRINGKKAGRNVLDPGWTTFEKRNLYTTYDVTAQLRQGANAICVMLGNGWAVMDKRFGPPIVTPYASPALLLQIQVELEDGKRLMLTSDTSWKTASGPVVSNSIYDGESYDARLEIPGWDHPGFSDTAWPSAQAMKSSGGALSAQMMPPIRVIDTLVPVKMTNPQPGV